MSSDGLKDLKQNYFGYWNWYLEFVWDLKIGICNKGVLVQNGACL
jgi:hypothetical protein